MRQASKQTDKPKPFKFIQDNNNKPETSQSHLHQHLHHHHQLQQEKTIVSPKLCTIFCLSRSICSNLVILSLAVSAFVPQTKQVKKKKRRGRGEKKTVSGISASCQHFSASPPNLLHFQITSLEKDNISHFAMVLYFFFYTGRGQ